MNPMEYNVNTPLHHAVKRGTLNDVKKAMSDNKEYINVQNSDGNTALHLAVELNLLDRVKVLIEYGSDVNIRNSSGSTPLHFALAVYSQFLRGRRLLDPRDENLDFYWNNEITRLLIKAPQANLLNTCESFTYLHYAVSTGNLEATLLLIDKCKALVNLQGSKGEAALHLAPRRHLGILANHENTIFMICKALVGKGMAVLNIYDKDRNTPLHYAVRAGLCSIIEMLVDKGANWNAVNKKNETPLATALLECWKPGRTEPQSMENCPNIRRMYLKLDPSTVKNRLHTAIANYFLDLRLLREQKDCT